VDSYGCGDSFAAGLTYGLGAGMAPADALNLAARCGAVCLTGRGPYERQLTGAELGAGGELGGEPGAALGQGTPDPGETGPRRLIMEDRDG
jgi:ribokinase